MTWAVFGYQYKLKKRPYVYVAVSECKAWGHDLRARPDRKEAYLEAGGGEKPDGQGEFLDEPKKVAAAKKVPPQEMMQMVRQALKEVLAEDFPTFKGAKARQGVAARAKARLDGRNKNAK